MRRGPTRPLSRPMPQGRQLVWARQHTNMTLVNRRQEDNEWLLAEGAWDDSGFWADTASWID